MALVRIGEAAENVPWRGNGQKEQEAGDGLQSAPAAPLAGEHQVGNGRSEEEDGRDEALGEQSQGDAGPHPVKARRTVGLEAGEQAVEGEEQKEGQFRLGNDKACKEKRSDGGEDAQA